MGELDDGVFVGVVGWVVGGIEGVVYRGDVEDVVVVLC